MHTIYILIIFLNLTIDKSTVKYPTVIGNYKTEAACTKAASLIISDDNVIKVLSRSHIQSISGTCVKIPIDVD